MSTELKTISVRIPEEIRSRLPDEVERFSQMLAPRTGVPITASNLIPSFLEDFMDAMETGELPEWPIRIQRSNDNTKFLAVVSITDFQALTQSGRGPKRFLGNYEGILQTDVTAAMIEWAVRN